MRRPTPARQARSVVIDSGHIPAGLSGGPASGLGGFPPPESLPRQVSDPRHRAARRRALVVKKSGASEAHVRQPVKIRITSLRSRLGVGDSLGRSPARPSVDAVGRVRLVAGWARPTKWSWLDPRPARRELRSALRPNHRAETDPIRRRTLFGSSAQSESWTVATRRTEPRSLLGPDQDDQRIVLVGKVGKNNLGDIAVDDISLTPGACPKRLRIAEITRRQTSEALAKPQEVAAVEAQKPVYRKSYPKSPKPGTKYQPKTQTPDQQSHATGELKKIDCKWCGKQHVRDKSLCPAQGKTCTRCKKLNHLAEVCRSKQVAEVRVEPSSASSSQNSDFEEYYCSDVSLIETISARAPIQCSAESVASSNTAAPQIAAAQSGDCTFEVDECEWGNVILRERLDDIDWERTSGLSLRNPALHDHTLGTEKGTY
ncbi:unnamed protein product [Bemisia tabaci]|uniref:MAM domain-containing protein n=1 Tax=Bemisia tabaci TaxID=7038 RepID=A0A9N9ZYR2_BEMTA|nr:unnamed protein product [Bemisia tabaci]